MGRMSAPGSEHIRSNSRQHSKERDEDRQHSKERDEERGRRLSLVASDLIGPGSQKPGDFERQSSKGTSCSKPSSYFQHPSNQTAESASIPPSHVTQLSKQKSVSPPISARSGVSSAIPSAPSGVPSGLTLSSRMPREEADEKRPRTLSQSKNKDSSSHSGVDVQRLEALPTAILIVGNPRRGRCQCLDCILTRSL